MSFKILFLIALFAPLLVIAARTVSAWGHSRAEAEYRATAVNFPAGPFPGFPSGGKGITMRREGWLPAIRLTQYNSWIAGLSATG